MTISAIKHDLYIVKNEWKCCKCGEVKPLTEFYARKGSGCKPCKLAEDAEKRKAKKAEKIWNCWKCGIEKTADNFFHKKEYGCTECRDKEISNGVKGCVKCHIVKPVSEFVASPKYKSGYVADCNECRYKTTVENRAKIKADPDRHAKYKAHKNAYGKTDKAQDTSYRRRFGISLATVRSMHAMQHGKCANTACQTTINLATKTERATAVVDHCHATGAVRALLCSRCNLALGHIEGDTKAAYGLFEYLDKFNFKNGA